MISLAAAMVWVWLLACVVCVLAALVSDEIKTRAGLMVAVPFNLGIAYVMWSVANAKDVLWVLIVALVWMSLEILGSMILLSTGESVGTRTGALVRLVASVLSIVVIIWAMNN